ncbi:uncharacterized protein LOC142337428 isoform X2 [Convolutriloba macropyga]|uniref:uncharacterized protein LOC142337428 isoform X2 n=1 Tax=Convolutriloba macropyga TaxID=536237 RepID=UPI003F528DB8
MYSTKMSREWVHGVCGCTQNVPWCCITCWLPCVTSYRVGTRLGMKMAAIFSIIVFVVLAGADFISSYAYMNTDEFQRQINAGGSQDYGGIAANIYVEPEEDAKWMMIEKVFSGISFVASVFFVLIVFKYRSALREKHDLEGGALADCCLSLWCTSCVLCQMNNHQDHEELNGGVIGADGSAISRA